MIFEMWLNGVVMFCPCLFCPSDNFEHCFVLPMRWRASVCTLFYWYLLYDPRRCDNSRKVRALRRVSTSGAPHVVTWTKQTWIKHHNTHNWISCMYLVQYPRLPYCGVRYLYTTYFSMAVLLPWSHCKDSANYKDSKQIAFLSYVKMRSRH